MVDVGRLLRDDLSELEEYVPVKPLDVLAQEIGVGVDQLVKLDANENLYGASPAVYEAIAAADLHIYPDPEQTYLRRAIAGYAAVQPEQVVAGAGADDLIDIVLRVALPERVAVVTPGFGMYSFLARISRAQPIEVPRVGPEFDLDVSAVGKAVSDGARIVFLSSPNNPTGNVLTLEEARRLCALESLIVVDEAYIEFGGESVVPLLREYPNLVVLRTFSKWAGLAGLRVGYALCDAQMCGFMMRIKQPYNVSVAADAAARAAIEHRGELMEWVRAIIAERERMAALVSGLGWLSPQPSCSNFVLFQVTGPRPAKWVAQELRKRGVLVRYYHRPELADYIRITAGRPQDTDRLMEALHDLGAA